MAFVVVVVVMVEVTKGGNYEDKLLYLACNNLITHLLT